jgi:hypothetical protein
LIKQSSKNGYLRRREARISEESLNRQIIFGLGWGWILTIIGASRYLFALDVNDTLWKLVMFGGVGLLLVTISAPFFIGPIEQAWMHAAKHIGAVALSGVLVVVYLVCFLPAGVFIRWKKSSAPFYRWTGTDSKPEFEGWISKNIEQDRVSSGLFRPLRVIGYFIENGRYLYVPVLLILLTLGALISFASTSALAPFIYTLF